MSIAIPGIPDVSWTGPTGAASFDEGVLRLTAAPGTDWTNDALGGPQQHAATSLGFVSAGDGVLSARTRVLTPRTTYDAAVLAVWGDRDHWAKICFEFSPQGEAMVVSVVTNDFSDDCNSTIVEDDWVYLRVTRSGPGWAFHSSRDGVDWTFVRVFRLDYAGPVSVGFLSQSPTGETCVAAFDEITYGPTIPGDLRDGS